MQHLKVKHVFAWEGPRHALRGYKRGTWLQDHMWQEESPDRRVFVPLEDRIQNWLDDQLNYNETELVYWGAQR